MRFAGTRYWSVRGKVEKTFATRVLLLESFITRKSWTL